MLVIRKEQLAPFIEIAMTEFTDSAVELLAEHWPWKIDELGPEATRRFVATGVEKASRYGLHAEGDVLRLLNLMCLLGADFDEDPIHAWAREILDGKAAADAKLEVICSTISGPTTVGGSP